MATLTRSLQPEESMTKHQLPSEFMIILKRHKAQIKRFLAQSHRYMVFLERLKAKIENDSFTDADEKAFYRRVDKERERVEEDERAHGEFLRSTLGLGFSPSENKMRIGVAQERYSHLDNWIKSRGPGKMPIEHTTLDAMADFSPTLESDWDDVDIELLEMDLADYDVHGFMHDLEWWREFAFEFVASTEQREDVTADREKLLSLYSDTLNGYVLALKMSQAHGQGGGPGYRNTAAFMAVRAYRIFTREVCSVAQRMYPELDMEPLLKLD